MTSETSRQPSTPGLIGDAIRQATALVTTEIALVRLEATEKLTLALTSLVTLVVAAVFVIVALIFLLQGLVELLVALGLAAFVASFIVGAGFALLAAIAVGIAMYNLRPSRLKPSRSLHQFEATRDLVKGRAS